MSAPGVLHAVGVGPGDPELVTLKAARVLNSADVVFAASSSGNDHSLALSIAGAHVRPGTPVVRLGFPMTRDESVLRASWEQSARTVLEALAQGKRAAFITLGDPVTYSTFVYLRRTMLEIEPGALIEVVPGVSSIQASAAVAGVDLAQSGESLAVLSGVDDPDRLRKALEACDGAVILKAYKSFPALKALLSSMGLADKAVLVSRCGLEGEAVVRGLRDCPDRPPYFSLLLVKK